MSYIQTPKRCHVNHLSSLPLTQPCGMTVVGQHGADLLQKSGNRPLLWLVVTGCSANRMEAGIISVFIVVRYRQECQVNNIAPIRRSERPYPWEMVWQRGIRPCRGVVGRIPRVAGCKEATGATHGGEWARENGKEQILSRCSPCSPPQERAPLPLQLYRKQLPSPRLLRLRLEPPDPLLLRFEHWSVP